MPEYGWTLIPKTACCFRYTSIIYQILVYCLLIYLYFCGCNSDCLFSPSILSFGSFLTTHNRWLCSGFAFALMAQSSFDFSAPVIHSALHGNCHSAYSPTPPAPPLLFSVLMFHFFYFLFSLLGEFFADNDYKTLVVWLCTELQSS